MNSNNSNTSNSGNRVQQFIDAQKRFESTNLHEVVDTLLKSNTQLSITEIVEEIVKSYTGIHIGLSINKKMVAVKDFDLIEDYLFNLVAYSIVLNVRLNDNTTGFETIKTEGLNLFIKKNKDYGDAFAVFSVIGVIMRMGDKVSRLSTLVGGGVGGGDGVGNFESIADTAIDLYNYAHMVSLLINE